MIAQSNANIRALDGTLVQVFLGLMRHRKSTIVAASMGLTQPAISHALRRLRTIYGDPLFVRRPRGMEPTELAFELEPQLREAHSLLTASLNPRGGFDPELSHRTIRIAASDHELATILPSLIAATTRETAGLQVIARPSRGAAALAALADGEVDVVLTYQDLRDDRFVSDLLHEDDYRLVARQDHELMRGRLTAKRYAEARHLLISLDGEFRGRVDDVLERDGLRRHATAAVPMFFPALAILSECDLVATLPGRIAGKSEQIFRLKSRALPFASPTIRLWAIRSRRDARNPMHVWLLDQMRSIA